MATVMPEYWNEGRERDADVPRQVGLLKSIVTLLALVLAFAVYLLPNTERLEVLGTLAGGAVLVWLLWLTNRR